MRNIFIDTIIKECNKRRDILIISGDAGLGVFDKFQERFPGRFLNLGVAEQNAAGFSAGLSLAGYKVYLYNIIPFLLYRCYEQVRNDICYQKLPVVLVGIGSGVTYAPQGMTHYSVEDIGIARTLPNLMVFSPSDPVEAKFIALHSLKCAYPVYVRLAKKGEPDIHKDAPLDITKPLLIEGGEDVAILFHGSISSEVIKAREILKTKKIYAKLISLPLIQPLNTEELFKKLKGLRCVISVEEHFVNCGLGSILLNVYARIRPKWQIFTLGITYGFIHEIKDTAGMRDYFGISAEKIAHFIENILKRGR